MGSTKRLLPNNLTIEELLESAEDDKQEKEINNIDWNNDVVSFLLTFNIKSGPHPVPKPLFFALYKHWSKNPIIKTKFNIEIAKFLIRHQKGPNQFYLIDKDAFKISEEIQQFILKKTVDKTKSKSYKKHFENFLKKYQLKQGNYYVESYILYYLYDKWVFSIKKKAPLGENQFFNFCKLYFTFKRNSESRVSWFGVDKEGLFKVMSEQKIQNIRRGRHRRYGKTKQKKQNKISRN